MVCPGVVEYHPIQQMYYSSAEDQILVPYEYSYSYYSLVVAYILVLNE
jgi:hypothetical protein